MYLAEIEAKDLFKVKVEILRIMGVLDQTGDLLGRGARALENPRTATGEHSLDKLYTLLSNLESRGVNFESFSQLKGKMKANCLLAGSCMSGNVHVRLREKGGGQKWPCCTSLSSSMGFALSFLGDTHFEMISTPCSPVQVPVRQKNENGKDHAPGFDETKQDFRPSKIKDQGSDYAAPVLAMYLPFPNSSGDILIRTSIIASARALTWIEALEKCWIYP
uniref:DUF8018 domain-containing protein n=1 Tax=Solanum lycopersicum TaxID=4081 RepID=K4D8K7_SOLLC